MSINRPVLTGLRGFAGSPWANSAKRFDPVSREDGLSHESLTRLDEVPDEVPDEGQQWLTPLNTY